MAKKISYVADDATVEEIDNLMHEENRNSQSNMVDTLVKEALRARKSKKEMADGRRSR